MPQFDVQAARKAGYSDREIADHLATTRQFDAAGARKANYSDSDIIDHLSKTAVIESQATPRRSHADIEAKVGRRSQQVQLVEPILTEVDGRDRGISIAIDPEEIVPTRQRIAPQPKSLLDKLQDKKREVGQVASEAIELAQEPVSKTFLGKSLTDIANDLFPEPEDRKRLTPGQTAAEEPLFPTSGTVYEMARRGIKLAAGLGDWIQSPEAIAVAAVEAATAGAATPVVAKLLGAQFLTHGGKEAVAGLEDIRKNGLTPENTERFLSGLMVAEAGLIGPAALRQKRLEVRKNIKAYDQWIDIAKSRAEQAARERFERMEQEAKPTEVVPPVPEPREQVKTPVEPPVEPVVPEVVPPVEPTSTASVEPKPSHIETHQQLRQHPVRGEVGKKPVPGDKEYLQALAEEAKSKEVDVQIDYLDKLEDAMTANEVPQMEPFIAAARDALLIKGDHLEYSRQAEVARNTFRNVMEERAIQRQADAHGLEMSESLDQRIARRAQQQEKRWLKPEEKPAETSAAPEESPSSGSLKRTPAEDKIISDGVDAEMRAWVDLVRHSQEELKRGESRLSTESNAEGKLIEEQMDARSKSIHSSGVKEGSPLAKFEESPGELADVMTAGLDGKLRDGTKRKALYDQIRKEYDGSYADTYLESIRDYLTRADENAVQDLLGDTKLEAEADISFDFGENALKSIDAFEAQQKQALKDLIRGAGSGSTAGMALPIEVIGRLAAIGAAKLLKAGIGFYRWAREMREEFADLNLSSTDLQRVWDEARRRVEPLANTTAAERERLPARILDRLMETGEIEPVGKLIIALERASTSRRKLEREYTKERSERAKEADLIRKKIEEGKIEPEIGQALLKSKFKGEMAAEHKNFEPLRLEQAELDSMFREIAQHERFGVFEVMAAIDGMQMILKGRVPKNSQIDLLRSVFGKEFGDILMDKRSFISKLGSVLAETANLPRTLMASMDMSAPLRQGIILTATHPFKYGAPAFREMFRQVFSPANFKAWQEGVRKSPEYKLMQESELYMADPLQLEGPLSRGEERFVSSYAERMHDLPVVRSIPGVRDALKLWSSGVKASERAYVAYLNKLRFDAFNHLSKQFMKEGFDPAVDMKPFKSLASFVNNATGRGDLGKLKKISEGLSMVFFSPKLIAARFQMLNPHWYFKQHPRVRMEAIKTMGQFVGTGLAVLALMKAAGAQVEADPRSTDFGKIKIGNTRWDIWGGFQQWVRAFAQIVSGYRKTGRGDVHKLSPTEFPFETRKDVAERFVASKLAPVPQLAYELMIGQKMFGGDITLKGEAAENAVPLYLQDMKQAIAELGPGAILATGVPGFFGVGVQTYTERPPSSAIHSQIAPSISEPVTDALMKAQVSVGRVERQTKEESAEVLRLRTELTGKLITDAVEEIISDPGYANIPADEQKAALQEAIRRARLRANRAAKQEFDSEKEKLEFLQEEIGAPVR